MSLTFSQPPLPQALAQHSLPDSECQRRLLAAQAQLQNGTAELQAELLQSQARLAELEAQVRSEVAACEGGVVMGRCHCERWKGWFPREPEGPASPPSTLSLVPSQVRKLELERTQHELLLESLQQRHQADLELIENAHRYPALPAAPWASQAHGPAQDRCAPRGPSGGHPHLLSTTAGCSVGRSRVKVLEASYQQREERLRRENEELSARYLSHCQEAEQARTELLAQHQRRLAAAAQEKDQEMERLRELQR